MEQFFMNFINKELVRICLNFILFVNMRSPLYKFVTTFFNFSSSDRFIKLNNVCATNV